MKTPAVRWLRLFAVVVVLAALGAGGWWYAARAHSHADARPEPKPVAAVSVEVVAPRAGGIDRMCTQVGTIEPFRSVELYAKVSGFLAELNVNIGSAVHAGDVLARIAVPELEKQEAKDKAEVKRAEARLGQMNAGIVTAEADLGSATAQIAFAKAEQKSKTAYRAYREKQRARIAELVDQKALERKLADEQEDQYEAAVSAEIAAGESVNTAKQKEAAAKAKVEQTKADLKYAEAELAVAKAQLERSETLVGYTVIRAPFDGVVTQRSVTSLGAFIKSAESGGDRAPLFTVEQTDVMLLIVQVPDRDVPYVNAGDPVAVRLDALPGEAFRAPAGGPVAVSRTAESEDSHTKMMRTEIDLKNDGRLRRGMFGRASITLQTGAAGALRIPSTALVGKAEGGAGSVRVVRGDTIHTVPVKIGADTGALVEVLSGLSAADRVVVRVNGTAEDGAAVVVMDSAK